MVYWAQLTRQQAGIESYDEGPFTTPVKIDRR